MSKQKRKKSGINKPRVIVPFNTGTRVHKTDKYPSRARRKELERQKED